MDIPMYENKMDYKSILWFIKDKGEEVCNEEHEDETELCCVDLGVSSFQHFGGLDSIWDRQCDQGLILDGILNRRIRNQMYYSFGRDAGYEGKHRQKKMGMCIRTALSLLFPSDCDCRGEKICKKCTCTYYDNNEM